MRSFHIREHGILDNKLRLNTFTIMNLALKLPEIAPESPEILQLPATGLPTTISCSDLIVSRFSTMRNAKLVVRIMQPCNLFYRLSVQIAQ